MEFWTSAITALRKSTRNRQLAVKAYSYRDPDECGDLHEAPLYLLCPPYITASRLVLSHHPGIGTSRTLQNSFL